MLPEGVTLNKLLNEEGNWKINEVYSWFHKDDIPWVLGILPITSRPDWITWSLNPNGQYTVASGYKLRFKNPNLVECLDKSTLKAWWKFIWGSKLIPKMKNFIWRVFNQWMTTKVELTKRDEMMYFIGVSWLIWQRRNKLLFQNKAQEDHVWVMWAQEVLEVHLGEAFRPRKDIPIQVRKVWQPPLPGFVTLNTDASIIHDKMGCGLSVVIRDHDGNLIVAETKFLPGYFSVYLAEVAAIRLGVNLVCRWSLQRVCVAIDCLGVVAALKTNSPPLSNWGMVVREVILLKQNFIFLQFFFINRECNAVANALAIWSRMTHSSDLWTGSLPCCAAAKMLADKPGLAV
ncbi:hypothetical protein F8388_010617 [Cannabis sativa]|uniref:RNase H type-1 domain-containing protein n=1 Tax=Cannabis sativa TaxID=3483 RepID=A0A7J6GSH8_CANSA|nr:hypothetical protein F8388_010617 [Cannabis sativa]